MFSSTLLWVSIGLVFLLIAVILNTPRARAARTRRSEEYRRQEEERKEKERAEAARKERQMEIFRKQRVVVYVREKDGRKSSFEAVLVRMLLTSGIIVETLPENDGRAIVGGDTSSLKGGLLAIVGTSWRRYASNLARTYCDYRLLAAGENGAGKILGAGCDQIDPSYENILAKSIIRDLASTLPETSGNK